MKWAIVGGGVLGMRLADVLAGAGHEVTLFEASARLGGLAAAWKLGDVRWDRHYHVTLLSDTRTRAMYQSVGLGGAVRWTETRTGFYGPDGVLRSVSDPREFLRLPTLSTISKVRIAGTLAYGSLIRDGARMERIEVDRWLTRWSGRTAFEQFWRPLLRAKLGDAYPSASAALIWSTIRRLSAARRNGLDRERFGYVAGGYDRVFEEYERKLAELGVDVRTSSPVESITGDPPGVKVTAAGRSKSFDRAVVTTSARRAAAMCPTLLPAERERLERVEYVGIVCVALVLRRPLADFYLTYVTDPTTPFTAVVEMTAFIDPAEVGGRTLVYLPKYADAADPIHQLGDPEVIERFVAHLERMYPRFEASDVLAARVSREREVFAVPTLGYSGRAPSIGTSVAGLSIAGSANLAFSTLNVNDTLSLVDDVLDAAGVATTCPPPNRTPDRSPPHADPTPTAVRA